jgi:acyl-CoA thioester hydrolase
LSIEAKRRVTETTFRVRFAETDQMGIVHHSAYVVYLEEGRSDFSRQIGAPYSDFEKSGFSLAVSELSVRYIAAARYDDLVIVRTWVEQLGSRAMTYNYEVVLAESGQILATGVSRHVCVDNSGQVRRIPQDWFERWQALINEA